MTTVNTSLMIPPVLITVVRYLATAALTGLTAAFVYFPKDYWIPVSIAVIGSLGIHVIPSAVQAAAPPRIVVGAVTPQDIEAAVEKNKGAG